VLGLSCLRLFGWICLASVVTVVAVIVSCDVDECGDIDTLDIGTTQVCFSVASTCTTAAQVVSQTQCGSLLQEWAVHASQAASCSVTITCADGRVETLQVEWASNGQCAPATVIGGFGGTVCDVDGGIPPMPEASSDSADDTDAE
jgi:hypothetical protein